MKVFHRLRDEVIRLTGPMTPLGRSVLLVGVVAWLVAIAFGWKEFAVVAGVCLIGVVIAFAFTFGRTQLELDLRLNPQRVLAGETAVAEFDVRNVASRRMLPVRLEVPINEAVATIAVPTLAPGETFEEVIIIPTTRRCVLRVGPTRSVRGDPLSLTRREVVWEDAHQLFVHPRTSSLQGVASGWLRDLEGRPTNDRSPSDVAFHTLREYVPGDDRRHVHWRTSARIDKLMVRQFIDNRRSHLGILIDTNPASYADADEFELAVSMAGSLGLRAISEGQETSCVAGASGVNAHTGQTFLDGLSAVELGVPAISMQEAAVRAAPLLRGVSVIALVTGSVIGLAELQLAGQRFGLEAQLLVIRADVEGNSGLNRHPRMSVMSADSLDAFTRVMWAMAGS